MQGRRKRPEGRAHACYQQGSRLSPAGVLGTAWHTHQPFASVEGSEGAVMPVHQLPVFPGWGRFLLLRHWWQGEEVLGLTEDSLCAGEMPAVWTGCVCISGPQSDGNQVPTWREKSLS